MQTINLCALCVLCGQEKSRLIQHRARRAETRRGAARIVGGRRRDGNFRIYPEPNRDTALARHLAVERNLPRRIEDDVVDEPQELVHLLWDKCRRENMRLAAEVVVTVLRLEKRTCRRACEILRAQRIDGSARKRFLRKEDANARTIGDAFKNLQIAHKRRFINDVSWRIHLTNRANRNKMATTSPINRMRTIKDRIPRIPPRHLPHNSVMLVFSNVNPP